ncbi:SRPBCC family protein [Natronocalculus amylovorans]|uniref:SRPBCC family protein n=1 Tax=Natronocalculus amylovorans TaxID=2917812 RepID=A0AAE3KAU6_9EURY|nr:SRPBCC family protein [Natronocalculus amylovorans]MCL9817064.1 SRPBCC family protein [Natronocalculus amylovorans]NUE02908.1 SRPBCC family protein [Halorubraceae archaeon YAN]
MTVRVSRAFAFDVPPERIWDFISDPRKRVGAISVVERFDLHADGSATWHVELPIPMIRSTIDVKTEEVINEPPSRVKFIGRSKAFNVTGEHRIIETDTGCRLENEFVVDGRLPGVERFFKRNFDTELENLESALREDIDTDSVNTT